MNSCFCTRNLQSGPVFTTRHYRNVSIDLSSYIDIETFNSNNETIEEKLEELESKIDRINTGGGNIIQGNVNIDDAVINNLQDAIDEKADYDYVRDSLARVNNALFDRPTTQNLTDEVGRLEGLINNKVEITDLNNNLNNYVDLQTFNNNINTKADLTDLNNLNNTVDNQQTTLTNLDNDLRQLNLFSTNGINNLNTKLTDLTNKVDSKANLIDLNNLNNTVTNHQSIITTLDNTCNTLKTDLKELNTTCTKSINDLTDNFTKINDIINSKVNLTVLDNLVNINTFNNTLISKSDRKELNNIEDQLKIQEQVFIKRFDDLNDNLNKMTSLEESIENINKQLKEGQTFSLEFTPEQEKDIREILNYNKNYIVQAYGNFIRYHCESKSLLDLLDFCIRQDTDKSLDYTYNCLYESDLSQKLNLNSFNPLTDKIDTMFIEFLKILYLLIQEFAYGVKKLYEEMYTLRLDKIDKDNKFHTPDGSENRNGDTQYYLYYFKNYNFSDLQVAGPNGKFKVGPMPYLIEGRPAIDLYNDFKVFINYFTNEGVGKDDDRNKNGNMYDAFCSYRGIYRFITEAFQSMQNYYNSIYGKYLITKNVPSTEFNWKATVYYQAYIEENGSSGGNIDPKKLKEIEDQIAIQDQTLKNKIIDINICIEDVNHLKDVMAEFMVNMTEQLKRSRVPFGELEVDYLLIKDVIMENIPKIRSYFKKLVNLRFEIDFLKKDVLYYIGYDNVKKETFLYRSKDNTYPVEYPPEVLEQLKYVDYNEGSQFLRNLTDYCKEENFVKGKIEQAADVYLNCIYFLLSEVLNYQEETKHVKYILEDDNKFGLFYDDPPITNHKVQNFIEFPDIGTSEDPILHRISLLGSMSCPYNVGLKRIGSYVVQANYPYNSETYNQVLKLHELLKFAEDYIPIIQQNIDECYKTRETMLKDPKLYKDPQKNIEYIYVDGWLDYKKITTATFRLSNWYNKNYIKPLYKKRGMYYYVIYPKNWGSEDD